MRLAAVRWNFSVLCALLLLGCGSTARHGDIGIHELQSFSTIAPGAPMLASVEVMAPSWLEGSTMQYRLAYGEAPRRGSYGQSRWLAAPAEMLGQAARRTLLGGSGKGQCRLQLELDEFVQVFDAPGSSRGLIEVRASLLLPQGRDAIARQSFQVVKAAGSADAVGGAGALNSGVAELLPAIRAWLDAQGSPAGCQPRK